MFRRAINWQPSSSSLIAIFALVLATAGTATAASLITGKQILNGTITSADIKNGSVKGRDVKNGSLGAKELSAVARASLRGQTGAQGVPGIKGDKGDTGAKGDTGERGPSNAIFLKRASASASGGLSNLLGVLDLPPGNWIITAKLSAASNDADPVSCRMARTAPDEDLDSFDWDPLANNEATNVTLIGSVTQAGLVGLECTPPAGDTITIKNLRISAIQVGTLTPVT